MSRSLQVLLVFQLVMGMATSLRMSESSHFSQHPECDFWPEDPDQKPLLPDGYITDIAKVNTSTMCAWVSMDGTQCAMGRYNECDDFIKNSLSNPLKRDEHEGSVVFYGRTCAERQSECFSEKSGASVFNEKCNSNMATVINLKPWNTQCHSRHPPQHCVYDQLKPEEKKDYDKNFQKCMKKLEGSMEPLNDCYTRAMRILAQAKDPCGEDLIGPLRKKWQGRLQAMKHGQLADEDAMDEDAITWKEANARFP